MGTGRYTQIDTKTGELLDGFIAVVQPKRKNGFQTGGWVAVAQHALEILANIKSLDDSRVIMYLMSQLDFENLIQVQQTDVAEALGMQKQNVNRSIKRLLKMEVILEGPKIGRSRCYRLNPYFGWKGTAKNHTEALRATEKASKQGMRVIQGGIPEGDLHKQKPLLD